MKPDHREGHEARAGKDAEAQQLDGGKAQKAFPGHAGTLLIGLTGNGYNTVTLCMIRNKAYRCDVDDPGRGAYGSARIILSPTVFSAASR